MRISDWSSDVCSSDLDSIDSLIDWRCTARIKVKLQDNLIIRLRQCRRRRIRYQPAIEGKAFERAAQGRAATHRITKNVKGGRAHFSGDLEAEIRDRKSTRLTYSQ